MASVVTNLEKALKAYMMEYASDMVATFKEEDPDYKITLEDLEGETYECVFIEVDDLVNRLTPIVAAAVMKKENN